MRRLLSLLVLAAALVLPGHALGGATFSFEGHGWGHGIGMAQWGAYGFAKHGWKHRAILAHYYTGTELGPAPVSTIRVLLGSGRQSLEIGSESAFRVTDAAGFSGTLPAGSVTIGRSLTLTVDGKEHTLEPPVRFSPAGAPLRFGKPYRGTFVVRVVDGKLQLVNRVGLERYLWGVVPGEMPADWHTEALKVQAVAARSYAMVSRRTGGNFDVYPDTRDQVYGGVLAEHPRATAAVNATKGQVVRHGGKVAWTFFSSSSGGRTASIQDVWPDSKPLPYLVSVDDPYDTISPHHDWGPVEFTAEQLKAKLGSRAPAEILDVRLHRNASGRVGSVTLIGRNGEKEVSGWDLRIALGLRSTWFTLSSPVTLRPSARRVVYGGGVRLAGTARGAGAIALERRVAGGTWTKVPGFARRPNGSFGIEVRPKRTTTYRLRVEGKPGPRVRIAVAPKLTLERGGRARVLVGDVKPRRAGIPITIQRHAGGRWRPVATASLEGGAFRATLKLEKGRYRAWMPAARGMVAGTSRVVTVS